jgi:uncharacterized protein
MAITKDLELIFLFALIAAVFHWIAWGRGFFKLYPTTKLSKNDVVPIPFRAVLGVFVVYLGSSLYLSPLLARFLSLLWRIHPKLAAIPVPTTQSWMQLLTVSLTLFLIYLFCHTQHIPTILRVWKDRTRLNSHSILYDYTLGALCWIVSFPLVAMIGEICDSVLRHLFNWQSSEQVAVRYLKSTLQSPSMLFVALATILVAAPLIEEFLFRGMLQNWLKRQVGAKAAIPLGALAFALFHVAKVQGAGNISLVLSLFTFACYLGFVYERQGSLFASIGLHMTFNAISTFRILLS